ncbi:putative formate dehydrogenase [bacterium BMS3Abin07]|nr:putative formate dehydrogenase [bacterium BMS3Abin07]GBE32469.1 putative formate dehydrogenase [bacterium BMS3Bbin05]HDL20994.1 2Fe-2S iron-sulfur cluster binding domain-containing protein [Nitrospirota bacterium]HDO22953.1 2Fe-2S iron-sulfur cluster binding domain-containing protein [Nitrospirota bacterium]HDZ87947.1 2Fe-2S iron-sulfur cluster binding domain-containing protein [Nitrospirota bacterium]
MITVTINDREIKFDKAVTILEAARSGGIKIPTLCFFEGLEKFGGCRLCLVEVEKLPRLQTACTVMVTDGMVVRTETDAIIRARKAMLEFLLINHPLDCPYCDKSGECELQDLVAQYGAEEGRFAEGKRRHPESFDDPIIVRNMERCVTCTRCVRMCDGVQRASAITVTGRGDHSFVEPFSGGRYDCEYCGNCLTVCPVGAIMSRLHRHSYRAWFVEDEIETLCGFCGVGCSMILQMRENTILRAIPRMGMGINKGLLCARGRFGYDIIESNRRLTTPLVRKNGELKAVSWAEALGLVAEKFSEIKEQDGGEKFAGIVSPELTNEDNYVFQRFFRETLFSNNIDSIIRMFYAPAQAYFEGIFGQGITANLISGIGKSDAVVVAGGDPTKINPVLGLQVRAASGNGAKVVSLSNAAGLKRFASSEPVARSGSENFLYSALLKALIDTRGLPGRSGSIEQEIGNIKWPNDEEITQRTGLRKSDIEKVAEDLKDPKNISVIIGPDIMINNGLMGLFLIAAIIYVLDARIYLLSERPNEQGVIDTGCMPDTLPGGRPLEISSFREKFEQEMGYGVPGQKGLTLFEMFEAIGKGDIKAAYVMGDNPVFNLPAADRIREAMSGLDFLVVQDAFLSETAKMADVVLPAALWAEKDGTYVNLERRIQRLHRAKKSVGGLEGWQIIAGISGLMGSRMEYNSARDIWEEITRASHLYGSVSYEDLATDKSLWPYKGEPLRSGKWEIKIPEEVVEKTGHGCHVYPDRLLFHSGSFSRYSPALNSIQAEPYAVMHPDTAKSIDIKDGDRIKIAAANGWSIELVSKVDNEIRDFSVRVPNVFEGVCVMSLVDYGIEPGTGAPVWKLSDIKIEKVQ